MSKVLQNAPRRAFCNTFDLHEAIIGLENQFLVFFLRGRLGRLYCTIHLLFNSSIVSRGGPGMIKQNQTSLMTRRRRIITRLQNVMMTHQMMMEMTEILKHVNLILLTILDVRKPVFRGLQKTHAQTSLRVRAV